MKAKINITMEIEVIEAVDVLAEGLGKNRSQMIENLVSVGLGDAKFFKKLGLLDLATMVTKLQLRLKVAS
jgi:metal-responsive CopG/Arc/MetJ family transcriptional regulator